MKFKIAFRYKLVAEFTYFQEYANHPLGAMNYYADNQTIICLDGNGASCKPNQDTIYPVTIYRYEQHSDN